MKWSRWRSGSEGRLISLYFINFSLKWPLPAHSIAMAATFVAENGNAVGLSRAKSHHVHTRSQFIADNGHTARLVSFSSFRLSNRSFGNPLRRSTLKSNHHRSGTHRSSQTRSYSNIHQLTAADCTSNARAASSSNGLIRSASDLKHSAPHTPLTAEALHSSTGTIVVADSSNQNSSSPTNNSGVTFRNCRSASPNIDGDGLSPITPTNLSVSISNFSSSPIHLDQFSQISR